jgi:hypothetical protein
MHKYLTDFENYNEKLPIYLERPFNNDQLDILRASIEKFRLLLQDEDAYVKVPGEQEEYYGPTRFYPKKIVHMSRLLMEFECPPEIEAVMDAYCKKIYKEPLRLTHYNYIDYNTKYGNGKYAPTLTPHIDADENIVTFNFQIGGNVDDWTIWVDETPYDLKNGDAIIFSAVNQVHWRSKRKWKPGEFVEIVSFDYCPLDNYKLNNGINPIDPMKFPEERLAYNKKVAENPKMQRAWSIYNNTGLKDGIPQDKNAEIE